MSHVLGLNGKMYRNTGSYGTPTWTLFGNVKDLTLNMEKASADASTRGNGSYRATVGTLKDVTIEWESVYDTDDTGLMALHTAWLNGTTVEFLVLDGPQATAGSEGFRCEVNVLKFNIKEELEGIFMVEIEVKPTYSSNGPPQWVVMS